MPIRYIVKPGDHLAKIAANHGISSYLTLWTAGDNAELRAKRKNPNVLFAGDVVDPRPTSRRRTPPPSGHLS